MSGDSRQVLHRLLTELPAIGSSENPDEQIRAVLGPLVARAVSEDMEGCTAVKPDPTKCPNCGGPCDSERSPYCSSHCRDMAAFIRQFRGSIASQSIFDPERQAGTGQALWNLLGGGYPRRQSMVPARVIAKVITRDGGVCSVCGGPATEIEHTGSG